MKKIINIIYIFIFFITTNIVFSAKPISYHKDWTLFQTKLDEKDICYIAALPIKKEGTYKKRGEPYLLVMREKNSEYDEVGVSSGFIYHKDKGIELSVLKRKFPLFPDNEKAWTYDRNDDVEIVKFMKLGAKLYVTGYSKNNYMAMDTYSLIGFNEAYTKIITLCE